MKKQIKSFKYSDPKGLKVGDDVFLGDVDRLQVDYCSQCKAINEEDWIENNAGKLIFDKPCQKHNYE